jgi:hypothetical protein
MHNTTVTVHKYKLSNIVAFVIIGLNTLYLLYQIALVITFSIYLNRAIDLFQYKKQDILAANLSLATLSVICAAIGFLVIAISLFERLEQRILTYMYLFSLLIFGVGQLIAAGFMFPYPEDLRALGIPVFIICALFYLVMIPAVIARIVMLHREDQVPDFEEKVVTPAQVIVHTPLMQQIDGGDGEEEEM